MPLAERRPNDRFMALVSPEPMSGCWLWTGAVTYRGYGLFKLKNKSVSAHRYSYEAHNGEIPKGLVIDHLCRNTVCVNPSHLEAVTPRENTARGIAWVRSSEAAKERTTCKRGHTYLPESTYYFWRGKYLMRTCNICRNLGYSRRKIASR